MAPSRLRERRGGQTKRVPPRVRIDESADSLNYTLERDGSAGQVRFERAVAPLPLWELHVVWAAPPGTLYLMDEVTRSLNATTVPDDAAAGHTGALIPGRVIAGRYMLGPVLGEGGMGTVYRAEQTEPVRRQVALKLVRIGMDSRAVLARFDAERQALALMDHPNIARVYDGGTTEAGQPFFVMELVQGLPITDYCDQKRLPVHARLGLFVSVCQAVQHAHQKGIIHRDLKPSNVMVTEVDGKAAPKVIDFGVAKATEFNLTELSLGDTGAIVGTPTYMSPEQADPSSMDIDTRTDVYALGVILYELLAGSPPLDPAQFKRGAILEMLRMVREVDPPSPSTKVSTADALPNIAASRSIEPAQLKRALKGDLDWIVMKALEKDRNRRYDTANGFAADLTRHLASEPVLAAPPSRAYRARKFVRKHRGAVVAASLVLLALVAGIAGTTWGMVRASRARDAEADQLRIAKDEKRKAEQSETLANEQRARALERETQAIDAVKRFRDAVANEPVLKNNPQLAELRKRLLKEPLAFFKGLRERLQADRDTHPESLARLAEAGLDLGTLTYEIGDKQDSLIVFRESLAIFEKLAVANPAVTVNQKPLANSYSNIAFLLSQTGRPAEALKFHEKALALFQKLADSNPGVTDFQSKLAQSLSRIGVLQLENGRRAEALTAQEKALQIREKLADSNPTVTEFQSGLAESRNNIGVLLRQTGKSADALKAFEAALMIRQKLADSNPLVTDFQSRLADSRNNIALLLGETGKLAEALKVFELALAIRQKLADSYPAVTEFQSRLADGHNNIGRLLRQTGKPADALKANERALEIRQKLAEANPAVTELQSGVADSQNNIGVLLYQTGKPADALQAYERALLIRQKLADSNPAVTDFQRRLAESHYAIGLLLSQTGKPADAQTAYDKALVIRQKLADSNPAVTAFQNDLATSYDNIGSWLSETGRPAEAIKSHESALAIRQKLAQEHPESPEIASNLGGTLNNIALVDLKAGRFEAARARLRQAIEWQRKALAANPANPQYRRFLNNHLSLLSKAERDQ